jgi:outer membrane immunogenic protein
MQRLFLVGVIALTGLASQANAADLGRRPYAPPAPVYSPIYNWTGLYIGVNGGGGWGDSTWTGQSPNFGLSGGLVGGTIGYNWQFGQTVVGLEGDLNWSDIRGSGVCAFGCETRNNWFGTVRGRLGYAWDRFMPYITGGLAYGNIEANPTAAFVSNDATNAGWALGVGVEFALAQNWTAKVEYLHYDLGDFNCTNCAPAATTVDFNANIIRGGINYRF